MSNDNRESNESTFYWPRAYDMLTDGTLVMHATGYTDGGDTHWTGSMRIQPDDSNYTLWRWVVEQERYRDAIISDREIERLREEFRRSSASLPSDDSV